MAEITLLTPEQLSEREPKKGQGKGGRRRSPERTRIIEGYKAALQDAQPGYAADIMIESGEDKRVVRQDIKVAADELGKPFEFRPRKDRSLHIRFITAEEKAA